MTTTQRVSAFKEACAQTGKPEIIDLSVFPEELRDYMYAQYKMCVITEAINGDWKADWNDTKQKKFIPWFDNAGASSGFAVEGAGCCCSTADAGYTSRLCFSDRETAEYAGRQFLSIWEVIIMG